MEVKISSGLEEKSSTSKQDQRLKPINCDAGLVVHNFGEALVFALLTWCKWGVGMPLLLVTFYFRHALPPQP